MIYIKKILNNSFFSGNSFQLILFQNNINSANNSDPQPKSNVKISKYSTRNFKFF